MAAMATASQHGGHSMQDLALQISSLVHQCTTLLKSTSSDPPAQSLLTTTNDTPAAAEARAVLPADLRNELAEAALSLWQLAIGPEERVRRLTIEWSIPAALRYIVHFGIADLVPADGSDISYAELASAAKVPEAHLKRIVRLAATAGVFREGTVGHVAHTMLSIRFSKAYPELASYSAHVLEFTFPVVARMPEMSEKWQGSDAKTHTAFNVAHNTDEALFAWLQHEPEHAKRFVGLMDAMRRNPTWDVKHLVDGWQGWKELPAGSKIVDVGGSVGHTSFALADKYEELDFVVQDLPYVIAGAKGTNSVPEKLQRRVQLDAHDFFTGQPVKDADIYLLRQIMHDWADESAARILQSIVPAMQKQGSRILIMDQVVPSPGTLAPAQEREARTADLVVMSHFNGKQRDLEEWKKLLQMADSRLNIAQFVQPVGSHFAIIEVTLEPATQPPVASIATTGSVEVKDEVAVPQPDTQEQTSPLSNGVSTNGPSNGDAAPVLTNGSAAAAQPDQELPISNEPVKQKSADEATPQDQNVDKVEHRKTDSVTEISESDLPVPQGTGAPVLAS